MSNGFWVFPPECQAQWDKYQNARKSRDAASQDRDRAKRDVDRETSLSDESTFGTIATVGGGVAGGLLTGGVGGLVIFGLGLLGGMGSEVDRAKDIGDALRDYHAADDRHSAAESGESQARADLCSCGARWVE